YELLPSLHNGPCNDPNKIPLNAFLLLLRQLSSRAARSLQTAFRTERLYAIDQNRPGGTQYSTPDARISPASETMSSGSTGQTSFAAVAATAMGLASIPTVGRPNILAAKFVVPRPQNGSSTRPSDPAC